MYVSLVTVEDPATNSDFEQAMQNAQNALQQANNNRASALADAKQKLEQAKKDAQSSIDSASRQVSDAQAKMDREFGMFRRNRLLISAEADSF